MAMSWSVLFMLGFVISLGGFLTVYIRGAISRVDGTNPRQ